MTSIETLYQLFQQHPTVTTDSRNCPAGSIFFALKGENFNGNEFAAMAIGKGCQYAVVDEPQYATCDRILLVENSLRCLQQLAAYHRHQLSDIPVICITGTNGKTTTKELTAAVLSQKYNVLYTQGNLNNSIGTPLTVLKLNRQHQLAVIEIGASHPGDINELVEIAQPNYGLITNVGRAHLQGFGSFEGVIKTKGELYEYLRSHGGKAIVNRGNQYLMQIVKGLETIEYQPNNSNSLINGTVVSGQATQSNPLNVLWHDTEGNHSLSTNLTGDYNLENVLAAICCGKVFQVDDEAITRAISQYIPSNNRSQCIKTALNTLIVDAYNANPSSMAVALDNFLSATEGQHRKKCVILGSMKELGSYSRDEHRAVLQRIADAHLHAAFFIGEEFASLKEEIPNPAACYFENTESCRIWLTSHSLQGYTILLKGSHSNRLDTLVEIL